jgi:hypothetical protein
VCGGVCGVGGGVWLVVQSLAPKDHTEGACGRTAHWFCDAVHDESLSPLSC